MANLMANADCSANVRMGDTKQDNFQFLNAMDASQCIKVEQDSIDLPGDEIDMDIQIAQGLHPTSPKKRAIEDSDSMSEVVKKSVKSSLQNEDALLPFGLYVASELNQLRDPHSLAMAKLKISQILFKAAMGAYAKTEQQQQQQMQLKTTSFVGFEESVETNSTGTSPSVVDQKHVMSNLTLQDNVEDEFLHIQ
ncbi:uncharacterized protein LOC143914190 [Arctopsyche grandis]|uniref:uncharacterized protein LOC143914190 n=1 Tax=Arctopsyche grandis TaxID=121162 RepID=UPI00406DA2D9